MRRADDVAERLISIYGGTFTMSDLLRDVCVIVVANRSINDRIMSFDFSRV